MSERLIEAPKEDKAHPAGMGGVQRLYEFDNGYGASVIRSSFSYGGSEGYWELAVLGVDGHIVYDTPITSDVLGWLTEDGVEDALQQIAALPKVSE